MDFSKCKQERVWSMSRTITMKKNLSSKLYSCSFFVLFLISYIILLKSVMIYFKITNSYFYPITFFLLLGANYVLAAVFIPRLNVWIRRLIILMLMSFIMLSLMRFVFWICLWGAGGRGFGRTSDNLAMLCKKRKNRDRGIILARCKWGSGFNSR